MFDSLIASVLGVADNLTASLLSFIAMASISMGGATLLFTLFSADLLIGIGLALGPILLALSVFGTFRGLLSNWINFMLGAMGTKIVATIIAATVVKSMQSIQFVGLDAHTAGAAFANTAAMMGIIFLGIIVTFLAKDAGTIATGLFGGISISSVRLPDVSKGAGGWNAKDGASFGKTPAAPKPPAAPGGKPPAPGTPGGKPPTPGGGKPAPSAALNALKAATPAAGKSAAVGRFAGQAVGSLLNKFR